MFNLQGSELIIILLLALVVLGPEKLPQAMRKAGKMYADLKKMSTGFQQEFKAAVEEPMREVRATADLMRKTIDQPAKEVKETANLLRDSADFRKLQDGDRAEKPKSAEMVASADPAAVPSTDVPFASDSAPDPASVNGVSSPDGDEPWTAPDPFGGKRFSAAAPVAPINGDDSVVNGWGAPDPFKKVPVGQPVDAPTQGPFDAPSVDAPSAETGIQQP